MRVSTERSTWRKQGIISSFICSTVCLPPSHYFWKRWFERQFYRWFYNAKLLWPVFLILRGTWRQSSAKVEVPHCSRESSTSMSRSSLCRYPGRCSENKKTTETTLSPSINNLLYSLAQKPPPHPPTEFIQRLSGTHALGRTQSADTLPDSWQARGCLCLTVV